MFNGVDIFISEAEKIADHYPELQYVENVGGLPYISGKLILRDKDEEVVDTYQIRIDPSKNYPFEFPLVFETGGRIPNNIDWHVFSDGHCCIKSIPEEALLCKKGITLHWFIEKQVKPYFFNQKFRELNGYFLHERSHGPEGNIEFFKEVFKTNDLLTIAKGLLFIRDQKEPGRAASCFCGSGLKYRKCHRETYRMLRPFSNEELTTYIELIVSSPNFEMK